MKKFLSLVLALVMTMSLVTISAGAKDFDDNGDIDYKEAVDVISALGIVDGYSDGSFRPDGSLTRGAAAKIICNLILGPTTASALSASTAPFKDVPTTNNFAGYITYCAQQGIISGYGDGTFRPTGTLTGNAFMKMLLGALGYDSSIEHYTGSNWQVNVTKQAIGIGLDDGNDDFVGSRTVTRQEACLYAFNMINATMVEYDQKSTVVVGDVTINNTSTRSEVPNTSSRTDGNIKKDELMQFGEKYFTKLVADPDTDDFGRPSTTWVYDGDDVGTYANDADATLVVADADKSLADLMTDSDYLNYDDDEVLNSANVYFNGMDVKGDSDYEDNASAKDLAGKGDILEVYENDDGDVTDIIIRSYTYAMIDTVDNDLSTSQENKGASVALDLVDVDGDALGNGTYYDDYDDSEDVLNGYSSSYTEGTAIAVALDADDAILDSYVMESVTGTPSTARAVETYSYDNALTNYYSGSGVKNGTITVGGDRYTYAAQFTGLVAGADVDFDEEYTVYLTAEGYALAVTGDSVMSLNDVYYIVGLYAENTHGSTYYYAQAISVTDGVEHQMRLDYPSGSAVQTAFGTTDSTDPSASHYTTVGELFKLDEDDNKYTVVNPGTAWTGNSTYTAVNAATLTDDVTSGDSVIRYNSTRSYIQDNTFFIGAEKTGNDLKVTTATGMMSVDKNSSTGLKVTLIMDGKDAVFVIYAATDLNGATNKDDVVYMTGDANTRNTKDTYEVDLMFLADMELSEDVTIDDDQSKQGFYTYSVSDNVYDLDRSADAITAVNTEDGYAEFVVLNEGRNNTVSSVISGTDFNDAKTETSDTMFTAVDFDAVSIADATVIDTRSSGDRSRDEYSNEITSPARLINALDKGWVVADLYLEDGDIIFVAVRDCKNSASAAADAVITATPDPVTVSVGGSTTPTVSTSNGSLTGVSVADTSIATATLTSGTITVTGRAVGTTTMRITAEGTNGRTVSKTVNITVTKAPAAPMTVLVNFEESGSYVDYTTITVNETEVTNGVATLTIAAPTGYTISGSNVRALPFTAGGTYTLTIPVTRNTYTVRLDTTGLEGASAEIKGTATVQHGDDLTVTISVAKTEGSEFRGNITATPDSFGRAVTDGQGDSSPLMLTVPLTDVTADVTITVAND